MPPAAHGGSSGGGGSGEFPASIPSGAPFVSATADAPRQQQPHQHPPSAAHEPTVHSSLDFRKDFFFRRRHGHLDWNKLLRVDLERVVRTVDVDSLQDNVEHVTFSDVTEHDLARLTDANFLQLFRLTQLIIEYLLNVQNFLLASAQRREGVYESVQRQLAAERSRADAMEQENLALKREVKYQKRVIRAYERNMGSKWGGLEAAAAAAAAAAGGTAAATPQKCAVCSSAFVNYEFLRGHYARRHPNEPLPPAPPAPAPAAPAPTPAAPQPTAQDFAQWKREMESALRAQLAEETRRAAAAAAIASQASNSGNTKTLSSEEIQLSQRLGQLESTLAAVLNNNVLPVAAGADAPPGATASRARGLRDDDSSAAGGDTGSRVIEEATGLREYVRRQMFDLTQEVRALRDAQAKQQQTQGAGASMPAASPKHVVALPLHHSVVHFPAEDDDSATIHGGGGNRFQSHAVATPSSIQHSPATLRRLSIIGGGVSGGEELDVQLVSSPSPAVLPNPLIVPPARRGTLAECIRSHENPVHSLFPDMPFLRARFPQREEELLSALNSFALIAQSVAARGEQGLAEVEGEVLGQGYSAELPEVVAQVENIVSTHYRRPQDHLLLARELAERQTRHDALVKVIEDARQREAQQKAEFIAARDAMEAAVLSNEQARERADRELRARQQAIAAQAREDERRMALQLREAGSNVFAPPPRPPALLNPSPSISAIGSPLPYTGPAVVGGDMPSPALSPYGAAPSPQTGSQHFGAADTPSNQPHAAAAAAGQAAAAGLAPPSARPAGVRRPKTLRTMDEEDDEDEDGPRPIEPFSVHRDGAIAGGAGGGGGANVAASGNYLEQRHNVAAAGYVQQQPQVQPLYSPPPMVPVAIPPRPAKGSLGGVVGSSNAGPLPPRVPPPVASVTGNVPAAAGLAPPASDAVEAFVPSVGSSARVSPALAPQPQTHQQSPVPSFESIQQVRQPVRRLSTGGGGSGGIAQQQQQQLLQDDHDDLLNRRGGGGSAGSSASLGANDIQSLAAASARASGGGGSSGPDDADETPMRAPPMRAPGARSLHTRGRLGGSSAGAGAGGVNVDSSGGVVSPFDGDDVLEQYEHSTARQDRDPGPEHEFGGLDDPYEEPTSAGGGGATGAGALSDGGGATNTRAANAGRAPASSMQGRLHSDDEGDAPAPLFSQQAASAAAPTPAAPVRELNRPAAPAQRTRQMSPSHATEVATSSPSLTSQPRLGGGLGFTQKSSFATAPSSAAAAPSSMQQQQQQGRGSFLGPPVSHSANFSVTNSADWKSDGDIMDDDVEELML